MKITTKLTIDMAKRQILEKVDAVQCDANTRAVVVTLTAGGLPWVPGDGLTVSVACKKPDRTSAWYDTLPDGTASCSVADNVVTAILAPEVLTAAGQVKAAIVFQDESLNQLATFPFIIDVAENPAAGNAISNSYYNLQTLAQINSKLDLLEQADLLLRRDVSDNRTQIDDNYQNIQAVKEDVAKNFAATAIICTAEGDTIAVEDSEDYPLQSLMVYGKSVQDGTGTPDAPAPIVSAGAEGGEIKIMLRDKLLIAEHPKDASVALGAAAVFTVKAVGKGLTYQWQYSESTNGADNWANTALTGFNTDNLQVMAEAHRSANQYRCVVTDADGNSLISHPAYLLINSTEVMTITTHPTDRAAELDEIVSFTVEAVGDGLSYQWQYSQNSVWLNTSNPGFDTDTLSVQALDYRNGYKYRCVITDSNGIELKTKPAALIIGKASEVEDDFPKDAQMLTIPTPGGLHGLPVSSGGNYTDEKGQMWLCDTVGSGRHAQRIGYIASYNGEEIPGEYMSSTGALTVGAEVLYVLPEPIVTELDAETAAAFAALHTYKPNTIIVNDAGAGMTVEYVADPKTYIDNKFAALATAVATN